MEHFAITIGRSLGSGGRYVGKRLAEAFGAQYFDKEILALAAKESGLCEAVFARKDEQKGFLRGVFGQFHTIWSGNDYYQGQLTDEALFRFQSDAIRKAAAAESCVFIGRCADYVLRESSRLVSVFIAADAEDRMQRIMERLDCDENAARKLMEQGDRERATFYNFYSDKEWGAASTYDLCINSSRLGLDATAELVADFVRQRLEINR